MTSYWFSGFGWNSKSVSVPFTVHSIAPCPRISCGFISSQVSQNIKKCGGWFWRCSTVSLPMLMKKEYMLVNFFSMVHFSLDYQSRLFIKHRQWCENTKKKLYNYEIYLFTTCLYSFPVYFLIFWTYQAFFQCDKILLFVLSSSGQASMYFLAGAIFAYPTTRKATN